VFNPIEQGVQMAQEKIRESIIAGSWYPANASALRKDLNRYLEQARPPEIQGDLKAVIVPHAGYLYSGGIAAHAYRLVQHQPFDRVLIIAPSHRAYFKGASVYTPGGYRTPLGIVSLDREIIDVLLSHPSVIRFVPEADAQEHSLEIQLPFLQVVLKEFSLTPIIMGEQSLPFCRQLAEVISQACRGLKVLLVASSDLSHFHPSTEAKHLDRIVCDSVAAYDPESLSHRLEQGECEACGAGPILTVMLAARELGANTAKVLHYANSGDISGDHHRVVGYLAAALSSNP
jgi:MEMO1 family protein